MDPFHIGNQQHEMGDWLTQYTSGHDAATPHGGGLASFLDDDALRLSDDEALYRSAANGWEHPAEASGMHDAAHLLDAYGVPHHDVAHARIEQVMSEITDGHKVILGLRDDRLAAQGALHDFFEAFQKHLGIDAHDFSPSQHAVAIKGVDKSAPEHPQILLHSPNKPEGPPLAYSLESFSEAWKGSDFSMIAINGSAGTAAHQGGHHLVSELAGLVASAGTLYFTGEPAIAATAGQVVEKSTDAMMDPHIWDSILKAI